MSLLKKLSGFLEPSVLVQPLARRRLRDDFPQIHNLAWPEHCWKVPLKPADLIREQILLLGMTVKDIERITIAYPHKRRPGIFHDNTELKNEVHTFAARMATEMPSVRWIVADGLCEKRHLNRSAARNQNIVRTILQEQSFCYVPALQGEFLPFAEQGPKGKEFFVFFDDVFCQGTTAVNMISYIEHNGGHVLAAFSANGITGQIFHKNGPCTHLTQQGKWSGGHLKKPFFKESSLAGSFRKAVYNTGAIAYIAEEFSKVATKEGFLAELGPEEHLDLFEGLLNPHGLSLATLTNGECYHLACLYSGKEGMSAMRYKDVVTGLQRVWI